MRALSELGAVVDPSRAASNETENLLRLQPPEGSGLPDPRPYTSFDETVVALSGSGASEGPGTIDTVTDVGENAVSSGTRGNPLPNPTNMPGLPAGIMAVVGVVVLSLLTFSAGQLFDINIG